MGLADPLRGVGMTNGLQWYQRYPRDFLEGTIDLTFEEKGAYAILLDLIYLRKNKLPDEPRFIAGHLNCSVRKWNVIRQSLIEAGKIASENGFISNARAARLMVKNVRSQDYPEIISTLSPDNIAEKSPATNENNDLQAVETETELRNIGGGGSAGEIADDWPDLKGAVFLRAICAEIGSPWVDVDKTAGLVTTAGRWEAWKREGLGYAECIETIRAVCSTRREPVGSWKYFDKAIARAKETRMAGLEKVEHGRTDNRTNERVATYDAIWNASESVGRSDVR